MTHDIDFSYYVFFFLPSSINELIKLILQLEQVIAYICRVDQTNSAPYNDSIDSLKLNLLNLINI